MTATCVAVAMVAAWLLAIAGVSRAVDGNMRRLYYDVRGKRDGGADIIFVAIDESTVDVWGPAPWPWDRYSTLIETLIAGGARTVAVLEPGPRVLPSTAPRASLIKAQERGVLVMPEAHPGFSQPALTLGAHGTVEALELGAADALGRYSITRQVVVQAGLEVPDGPELPVNFVGPPDALPTLPAHRVASGEIPARTFRDRVVVIGLRGERFAPMVPTPVGPMSPAEVHAHALLGLAHGAVWPRAPAWLTLALQLVLAFLAVLVLPRLRARGLIAVLAGTGLVIVAADYVLFREGVLLLGASGHLVVVAVAAAASWIAERQRSQRELRDLARWIAQRLTLNAFGQSRGETDEEFWERFARASRIYIDYQSTLIAPLPEGKWHVGIIAGVGAREADVHEMRRDIRREPYREAYLHHRPVWSQRQFMSDPELSTLIVPLVAFDRLLGLWVLNFERDRELGKQELELVEMMAEHISVAAERRYLQRMARPHMEPGGLLSDGYLLERLTEMKQSALTLVQEQQSLSSLFSLLPVGVLVSTLWGEIQFTNDSIRRFFASTGIDEPRRMTLLTLLSTLTGTSEDAVLRVMRALVTERSFVRLEGDIVRADGETTRYDMVLARLGHSGVAAGGPGEGAPALSQLVLTIAERGEVAVATEWAWPTAPEHVLDVRQVVRDAVAELHEADLAEHVRPVLLEMPPTVTKIAGDGEPLTRALRELLRDATSSGPADVPGRVFIDESDHDIVIRVTDPATTMPRTDIAAVQRGRDVDAFAPDTMARRLAELKRAAELIGGDFEVDSEIGAGTEIIIRMRKSDD